MDLPKAETYGYRSTLNATFPTEQEADVWVSPYCYGINQGPVVMMIENYQTEMIWQLMRQSPPVVRGLLRAGFTGGWLEDT